MGVPKRVDREAER